MRIIQLIDSLEIGGAEKMAVNYANALSEKFVFSGLVTTRKEGSLKSKIHNSVEYLFLNRKKLVDFKAILLLKKFCKKHKVQYIQAHSSSFFTAFFLKLIYFRIKIIWHDHNGLSEFLSSRKNISLKVASLFFEGIIVVNDQLLQWAKKTLFCSKIIYLPNFTVLETNQNTLTELKGQDGKRIICVGNLRFQKNHPFLIDVAVNLKTLYPDWSFHLLGKDFLDDYSIKLKASISQNNLQKSVFLYDSVQDVQRCISKSQIAIITSQSEGLPVVLLEFGLLKIPVIATSVGEIPKIIENAKSGYVTEKSDIENFTKHLIELIENPEQRKYLANNLNKTIISNHSQNAIIANYLSWISKK